ncbi:TetR/AcrR family transcriptional regulator [Qipengyuania qiaonensis]|uniref:TetR/AcrR family transcriptional regulator helix-turn-helix transcriptional regulator n=1 Tax=Qipengyuania qiaonensis TaxID=2867240 RepID=A0ABS7J7P4_9SPHN|nr:TetR/AcrR family transcriptional regulator [Qipengyuania qiaonensis]MBX7483341.1 TetR/AcrR family transcriptional regulator; helix-turn-helix transcriptional regulator [Qipengyuania qiaonensis]
MSFTDSDQARLAVSRHAAELFWKNGVGRTTGDAIAAAAGLSTRTIWRYFRSKEACIEPLLLATELAFVTMLRKWPRDQSIEACLGVGMPTLVETEQQLRDAVAAARIVSILPREPALRSAWLMACHQSEATLAEIVAERLGVAPCLEIRICSASIMAALRVVDEYISSSAINHGKTFTMKQTSDLLASAFRTTDTLSICDPVT